jgi:muconolactone delta-isomerase
MGSQRKLRAFLTYQIRQISDTEKLKQPVSKIPQKSYIYTAVAKQLQHKSQSVWTKTH